MNVKTLIVVGAGGHGAAVAEAAMLSGQWADVVFLDDGYPAKLECQGWPVIGSMAALEQCPAGSGVIVAIGNQAAREQKFVQLRQAGMKLVSIVHPKAWVSEGAALGKGVAVMAGAIVGINAKVGDGAIVNANATVDHDVVLEAFAHLGVGVQLAGGVKVGRAAWLQAGSCAGYRVVVADGAVTQPGTALIAD